MMNFANNHFQNPYKNVRYLKSINIEEVKQTFPKNLAE
jgi:hypothetical protein